MIPLAVATLILGYLLLYAGVKGGEVAQHPWKGLSR